MFFELLKENNTVLSISFNFNKLFLERKEQI